MVGRKIVIIKYSCYKENCWNVWKQQKIELTENSHRWNLHPLLSVEPQTCRLIWSNFWWRISWEISFYTNILCLKLPNILWKGKLSIHQIPIFRGKYSKGPINFWTDFNENMCIYIYIDYSRIHKHECSIKFLKHIPELLVIQWTYALNLILRIHAKWP